MIYKVGVYPGAFNPVHSGHIAFAKEAMLTCDLDKVVFLPEVNPRNKKGVVDIKHRIALLERATEGAFGLSVMQTTSRRFSVDKTLPELLQAFEGSQITVLIGSDVVRDSLPYWDNLDTVLKNVSLAISLRADDNTDNISEVIEDISLKYGILVDHKFVFVSEPEMSSTKVRNGEADWSDLPSSVFKYAKDEGLYSSFID